MAGAYYGIQKGVSLMDEMNKRWASGKRNTGD